MNITWLGHSGFRIEIGDQTLLIDPWLEGCPTFPDERRDEALQGATAIFLTHGHFDHASEIEDIARETGLPIYAIFELAGMLETAGLETVGFNKGGAVTLGDVTVTMVNATHSSSCASAEGPVYAGDPAGFMIAGEGRVIYVSGDTDIMADMEWMAELHKPDIGLLCAGGFYTMDMRRAAWAARRYFDFRTVVPCHFGTFDALEQSVAPMRDALPGVDVRAPEVMKPMTF